MKFLIWDFDGTLAYRNEMWSGTLLACIKEVVPLSYITIEQIRPFLQKGFPWHTPEISHEHITSPEQWWLHVSPIFIKTCTSLGFSEDIAQACASKMSGQYCDINEWNTYEESHAVLAELQQRGWRHVLLSNHVPELSQIIVGIGLDQYIEKVFNSAETGYEKPHPLAFQAVVNYTTGNECIWMIGDSMTADINGAKRFNMPGILVRQYHPEAEFYCQDLTEIKEIVDKSDYC